MNALDFAESGAYFVSASAHDVSFWYLSPPAVATTPTLTTSSSEEELTPRPDDGGADSASAPASASAAASIAAAAARERAMRVTVERHSAKLLEGHDKRNFIAVCCGRSLLPPPAASASTAASAAAAASAANASAENSSHLVFALTDTGILAMFEQKLEAGSTATASAFKAGGGGGVLLSGSGSVLWRIVKWLDAKLEQALSMALAPGFVVLAVGAALFCSSISCCLTAGDA